MESALLIPRPSYLQRMTEFLDAPLVKVLTGLRRSGKSTLLLLLKNKLCERGVPESNIISYNFESMMNRSLRTAAALHEAVLEKTRHISGRAYLLFDEIQNVTGWEDAVNSLRIDIDCDIFVTGSNAKLLSGELATLLAGRYHEIHVYPLSFQEYLSFPNDLGHDRSERFLDYLRWGGLPGVHEIRWSDTNVREYLTDVFNSIVLKDVVERHRIRDPELLLRVTEYLMDNIGNTFSAKRVADFVRTEGRKSFSTDTVHSYIHALEEACLFSKAPRYDLKGRKLLETMEKYYLADLGLRSAVLGYRDADISGALENVVFNELLRRGYVVRIGKQGAAEVDFVAERGAKKMYVQVCYLLTPGDMDREFGPLLRIPDNHEKVVLSMSPIIGEGMDGVAHENIVDWLLRTEH